MIIIKYRKPAYQRFFQWTEECADVREAREFIKKLGPEYECRVFARVSKAKLKKVSRKK